jgi:transcriptional regulator with XRE-family HTH domain
VRLRDPECLRCYLALLGWSERALAQRAGIGHATVNHLLSGRRTTCLPQTARAIELALGCPFGVFFEPVTSDAGRTVPTISGSRGRPGRVNRPRSMLPGCRL